MKIGIVSLRWAGHHTPYTNLTARSLSQRGHTVTIFIPENFPQPEDLERGENIEIAQVKETINEDASSAKEYLLSNIQYAKQIGEVLDQSYCLDILHFITLDILQMPLLAATITKSWNLPIAATTHRVNPYDMNTEPNGFGDSLQNMMRMGPQILSRASLSILSNMGVVKTIFVHSPEIKTRLEESLLWKPVGGAHEIPAPTPRLPDVTKAQARERLELPENPPILLFFGEARKEKGPDILLRSLAQIEEECCVVFAGKSDYVTETDIQSASCKEQVEVKSRMEYIPEDVVHLYFIAADYLVTPYRRETGISGPLRRSCMAGTPIIGSDGSDIGRIIQRNGIGETFSRGSPNDLARVINKVLSGSLTTDGQNVREFAESQSCENYAKQLEQRYRSVSDRSW